MFNPLPNFKNLTSNLPHLALKLFNDNLTFIKSASRFLTKGTATSIIDVRLKIHSRTAIVVKGRGLIAMNVN